MRNNFVRSNRKRISGSVIYKLQQGKENEFIGLLLYPYLTVILQALRSGTEIDTWCCNVQCCAQSSKVSQPESNMEWTLSSK